MNAAIYVCYSSKETNVTEYVCDKLEKAGLKCWMAHRDIPVGSDYAEQIPDAIANCKVFLLLMSDYAQKSKYVLRELNEAVDLGKVVIPFYIRKTLPTNSFQFFLKQYNHIEGFSDDSPDYSIWRTSVPSNSNNFGLRIAAIAKLIYRIKMYLGYWPEETSAANPIAAQPPQFVVTTQPKIEKRYTKKVFISHYSKEHQLVKHYVDMLEHNNIPCWISPRNIPYGSNHADVIPEAIQNSRCMLVFISNQSQSSEDIDKEIRIALEYHIPIIPVRLDSCKLRGAYQYHLINKQWFCAENATEEDFQKLLENIQSIEVN